MKASLSAVFSFDEIFPFQSTLPTYDRESVISELNSDKGPQLFTGLKKNSFFEKSSSSDLGTDIMAAKRSSSSSASSKSSLDLKSIYCSIIGHARNESKNGLALKPLRSMLMDPNLPRSIGSSSAPKGKLTWNSLDLDEKSKRYRALTGEANGHGITTLSQAHSFDFGDIYKKAETPTRDALVMEPFVTTAMVKFSKAFDKERKTAKQERLAGVRSNTKDAAERERERLKEFFFDPKVEFEDIYSEEDVFEVTAPSLRPQKHPLPRGSDGSTSIGTSSQLTDTESSPERDDNQDDPTEKSNLFEGFCSIEDLSLEFLTHLDFSELQSSDGLSVCKLIGQTFSFLETICLYKINELQMSAIFSNWISSGSAYSPNKTKSSAEKRLRLTDTNNTDPKNLRTKNVFILGLDRKLKHTLKCSKIYFDMQGKLGIKVKFISRH